MKKTIIITGETSIESFVEGIEDAYSELNVDFDTPLKITIEKVSEEKNDIRTDEQLCLSLSFPDPF